MSLKDWNAFTLEPKTITRGGTTRRGFEAVAKGTAQGTLGGLQDALRSGVTQQRRARDTEARNDGVKAR